MTIDFGGSFSVFLASVFGFVNELLAMIFGSIGAVFDGLTILVR
jgi:hypothetical protein